MKLSGMSARFVFVWVAYWLIVALQPAESEFRDVEIAWLLQFAFVFVAVVSSIFTYNLAANPVYVLKGEARCINTSAAHSIITMGYFISAIGLACILFDKVVLQGIDYSTGVSIAREQWRLLGEERDGSASSIFSAVGYLLGSAYFISLALVLSKNVKLSDLRRLVFLTIGFCLLLANSLITGGRSGILLAAAFVSFAYFKKAPFGESTLFHRSVYRFSLAIIILMTCAYVLYIFSARAAAGNESSIAYSLDFPRFLGLHTYAWFQDVSNSSSLGGFFALTNLAISYLTHSFATTAAIVEFGHGSGVIVFGHLFSLFAKIGVVDTPQTDWFLSGRFPSLPGALYYQFGLLGMLMAASIIGMSAGSLGGWYRRRKDSVFALFFCCIIESVMLLSPFLFAGDFLFFPFMALGGLVVLVSVRIVRGSLGI